jgi:predicted  nucleic acid-binding Zn-ribbon protein
MRLKEIQKPLSPQQARIKSMQNQVKNTQQSIKAARAREKIQVGQEQLRKISVV